MNMDVQGAAFTNPSSGKIDQQRKILEDLERQKKLLKAGGGISTASVGLPQVVPGAGVGLGLGAGGVGLQGPVGVVGGAGQAAAGPDGHITSGQRTALEAANKNSFGFFIPQDSAFGNIILPVIPRIQPKNPAVAK